MGDRVMDRNISPTGTGMAGMTSATKKERISSISLPCCFASSSVTLPTSQNTTNAYRTVIMLIGIACSLDIAYTSHPKFDPSTYMRLVLVPMDAQKGSIIYRLRAVDEEFDYPLTFELIGDTASATVMIESLPCTKYNSVCQANVVLQTRLEIGRFYDFEISVKDTNGNLVTQLCSITATNFTTPYDVIFPHKPGIIIVPEDAKRGTELDYVTARKNPLFQKPVYLELWGSQLFGIRQKILSTDTTQGTIFLLGRLDFEKQAVHHLTLLANDAYAEPGQDSRNIASLDIVVIVQDVQDQPPVFTLAPPVTKLPVDILPGDKVLKVHAEDGDKGNPREVRYGLVSENNPFTSFFSVNDTSGEIILLRPLEDIAAITNVGDPVLLTVVADEVKVDHAEHQAMASTVQLAIFLPERINTPPYFENDHYVSRVDENAPPGSALAFVNPYVPRVYDDDTDKNGVFSLTLINNNGTFEISPNVVERSSSFILRVRDNVLLDYEERHFLQLKILAQEIGPVTNLSATVNLTVYINDLNDNPPVFDQSLYIVELPENMTIGTKVVKVKAQDIDSYSSSGLVRYTAILGYLNTSLNLDSESGLITLATNNHGFDREVMPEYHLYVEARDDGGNGNRAQVPLIIQLLDVNDESPIFEKNLYEFILAPDLKSFTSMAFIHASDKDASEPNNEVRYEIINGNYDNKFHLEKVTGELLVREKLTLRKRRHSKPYRDGDMFLLTARAYDLGIPILSSTTNIRIYPPEIRTRTVTFVVPGANLDKLKTQEILSAITGGKVLIHHIKLEQSGEPGSESMQNSLVTATVLYDSSSVVDISQIQQRLLKSNGSYIIANGVNTGETDTLYKAENKLLFWLLILLASLVAVMVLIFLLCCIWSWCPLYGATSKKSINVNRTQDVAYLANRKISNPNPAKSVQVSQWNGRREAWSAEKSSDTRTRPTRWEFYNGSKEFSENVGVNSAFKNNEGGTTEDQHSGKIKRYTRDATFQNSKANIINVRDVRVEDVSDEGEANSAVHDIENMNYNNSRRALGRKQEIFIKDGNIEILKLMTTDKKTDNVAAVADSNNIYVNVPIMPSDLSNPQLVMIDNSGKEILMRRFIEEQTDGKQIIREHYHIIPGTTSIQSMPNEIQQQSNLERHFSLGKSGFNSLEYPHTEPAVNEMPMSFGRQNRNEPSISNHFLTYDLETSLKQQNEMLRKILLEKEKLESRYAQQEGILETQSLPGLPIAIGTQTECEVGTQTDMNVKLLQKPSKPSRAKVRQRKARSENDDSISDDEYKYALISNCSGAEGIYLIERKNKKNGRKYHSNKQPPKHNGMPTNNERTLRTPIEEETLEALIYKRQTTPQKPLRRYSETRKDNLGHEEDVVRKADYNNIDIVHCEKPDADNCVVKKNSESKDETSKEMYFKCAQENIRNEKKKTSRSFSEKDGQLRKKLNVLSEKIPQCSEHTLHDTLKLKSTSLKVLNRKHPRQAEKLRVCQSETDLNCQSDRQNDGEFVSKPVPKYMKWYFGTKSTANIDHPINSLTNLTTRRKENNTTEQRPSKAHACPKPANIINKDIKSQFKTCSLLKEDIEMNKQYTHKLAIEMNHPLLQHSEYRFERKRVPGFQIPSTKMSRYINAEITPVSTLKGEQDQNLIEAPEPSPLEENKVNLKNLNMSLSAGNSYSTLPTSVNTTKIYDQNMQLKASALEDDHDSGIAMSSLLTKRAHRNPIADKKSIFSIAYDDVNGVKKIASGGESPAYS